MEEASARSKLRSALSTYRTQLAQAVSDAKAAEVQRYRHWYCALRAPQASSYSVVG